MLTRIFGFLRTEDIKSCRLVCRTWLQCCENKSITDKEVFVFRSQIDSIDEINNFLSNYQHNISVVFVAVELTELNFHVFGHKVISLRIVNCYLDDCALLKTIFFYTPNMKSVHFALDKDSAFTERTLRCALPDVDREKLENHKLEKFEKIGPFLDVNDYGNPYLTNITVHNLCETFPRLRSITWDREIDLNQTFTLGKLDIINNLTELIFCGVNFALPIAWTSLAKMPKFV